MTEEICDCKNFDSNFIINNNRDLIQTEESYEIDLTKYELVISINSIENVNLGTDNAKALSYKIVIEHANIKLGEKSLGIISDDNVFDLQNILNVDYSINLPYDPSEISTLRAIVSSPLIITVYGTFADQKNRGISENGKNTKGRSRKSRKSSKNLSFQNTDVMGMCSIDLFPFIEGSEVLEMKVVLESAKESWDTSMVPWEQLPRISLIIKREGPALLSNLKNCNILSITVEKVLNLPESFNDKCDYTCGTVVYYDQSERFQEENEGFPDGLEKNAGNQCAQIYEKILFENGKWYNSSNIKNTKIWKSLENVESRAKYSPYALSDEYCCNRNDVSKQVDVEKVLNDPKTTRIEWNSFYRTLLSAEDGKILKDKIERYRYWPFQIMISEKFSNESKKHKINSEVYESKNQIFQSYTDLRQLLFPGCKKTRVVAPLWTSSAIDFSEKTGMSNSIFDVDSVIELFDKQAQKFERGDSIDANEETRGLQVFAGCSPTMLLVEFELIRPLIESRIDDDFSYLISELERKPKSRIFNYIYSPNSAYDDYIRWITRLSETITECYKDYTEKCNCEDWGVNEDNNCKSHNSAKKLKNCKALCSTQTEGANPCPYYYIEDEFSRFKQYLHEIGKYAEMRSTLKNKIINLLDQKFIFNLDSGWHSPENQQFVLDIYKYLVDEMHVALNSKIDVRTIRENPTAQKTKKVWFATEIAHEFGNTSTADVLLLRLLTENKADAEVWVIYAVHKLKMGEIDEAAACAREAVLVDSRNKYGLLLLGIVLGIKNEFTESEIFIKGLLQFYPKFAEGWLVLHLLYIKMQYYPGLDITMCTARECHQDNNYIHENGGFSEYDPIAWSTIHSKKSRIFIFTASLLLKLNAYEFAGLALAEDLCRYGRTFEFLYFKGVFCYLQADYTKALESLEEAESFIMTSDYSLTSLLGHCHYKMENPLKAVSRYEYVDKLINKPDDSHLVDVRLGFYYIDNEKYQNARRIFLRACRYSPSAKSWLGAGITSYFIKQFKESELCLIEANRRDSRDPEVWGYLCLISLSFSHYDEFTQCYLYTVKNNLKNDKLWSLIHNAMKILNYPVPVMENKTDICGCITK